MNNQEIVKQLKDSIEYRSNHQRFINEFLYAIEKYFLDKYDFHINTLTGVTWFAIEKNQSYYYGGDRFIMSDFKITSKVLFDFCQEFGCEFTHTACDGDRYFFTFDDVDMSNNKYNEMVTGNTLTKYELYDLFGLKGFH